MLQAYLSLMSKLPVWLLVSLSGIMVILGDYYGKLWSQNLKSTWFALALTGYILSSVFYLPVLLRQTLTVTSVIWSLVSIIGFMFIGLVLFKEQLNVWQTVGLVFGAISLVIFAFN